MGGIPSPRDESGFGLIELLISMVVLQVALLALVGAFGAGSVALGRAAQDQHRGGAGRPADGALPLDALRRDRARHRSRADDRHLHRRHDRLPGRARTLSAATPGRSTTPNNEHLELHRGERLVQCFDLLLGERHQPVHRASRRQQRLDAALAGRTNLLRRHVHQVRHADRGPTAGEAGLGRRPRGGDVEGACAQSSRRSTARPATPRTLLPASEGRFAKGRRAACR